jgi:hypothetical protein
VSKGAFNCGGGRGGVGAGATTTPAATMDPASASNPLIMSRAGIESALHAMVSLEVSC